MDRNIFLKHHQICFRVIAAKTTEPMMLVFSFALGIAFFFLVFQVWDIVAIGKDLGLLMDNLISTTGVISSLCKIAAFRWKSREAAEIISIITNDWRRESKMSEVMRNNGMWFKRVATYIIVMYCIMNFTYCLQALNSYIFDEVTNRKFLLPVKFPMDARPSPFYELASVGQFITATILINANAFIDGFLITLVLHACSKIDLVLKEIQNFSRICQTNNKCSKKSTSDALKKLHRKHLESIEFCKKTQDVYSLVAFFHISFLILLQVTTGFMFIDGLERGVKPVDLIHHAVMATSFSITPGYYCICGEYLNNQSEALVNELYNCRWYTFPIEHAKAIELILVRAQKPVNLTMGKFSNLSLIYFTGISKTSFSFLSLVRAVR